jgi:hypothetical protein
MFVVPVAWICIKMYQKRLQEQQKQNDNNDSGELVVEEESCSSSFCENCFHSNDLMAATSPNPQRSDISPFSATASIENVKNDTDNGFRNYGYINNSTGIEGTSDSGLKMIAS